MKSFVLGLFLSLGFVSLVGCSGEKGGGGTPAPFYSNSVSRDDASPFVNNQLSQVQSARAVFMSEKKSQGFERNQLFTLDRSGKIQELKVFKNERGGALGSFTSLKKSMVASYYGQEECSLVFIRKADGAVACLERKRISSYKPVFEDDHGNIYYSDESGEIYRADVSDLSQIKKVQITGRKEGNEFNEFYVSHAGDVFLYGNDHMKVSLAEGTSAKFGWSPHVLFSPSFDPTRVFSFSYNRESVFRKINGIFLESNLAGTFSESLTQMVGMCNTKNEVFGITPSLLNRFKDNFDPIKVASEGFREATQVACSANQVFVQGKDDVGNVMVKAYNVTYNAWMNVLKPGEFDIDTFDVDFSNDSILFYGARASDGVTLFGSVSDKGTITVLSTFEGHENDTVQKISILR